MVRGNRADQGQANGWRRKLGKNYLAGEHHEWSTVDDNILCWDERQLAAWFMGT